MTFNMPMFRPLLAAAFLAAIGAAPAAAMPGSAGLTPGAGLPGGDPGVVQVYGGCGPYGHRDAYGYCRPGGQAGGGYGRPRLCPPGYHIGAYGGRCWPNR